MAMKSLRLKINGMTCGKCVNHVDNALSSLDEVHEIMTTLKTGGVSEVVITLNSDISEEKLSSTISDLGYELVAVEQR